MQKRENSIYFYGWSWFDCHFPSILCLFKHLLWALLLLLSCVGLWMNWYALIATPVCLLNLIFSLLFIFALSSARHKRGQTFNLFNSIYQSISGHLNRKVNENTLDTEIFVESAAATKTEKPHARTKNVRM